MKSFAILISINNNSLFLVLLFDMANTISHSNNSLANCLSVFDHFTGLAFIKGLRIKLKLLAEC